VHLFCLVKNPRTRTLLIPTDNDLKNLSVLDEFHQRITLYTSNYYETIMMQYIQSAQIVECLTTNFPYYPHHCKSWKMLNIRTCTRLHTLIQKINVNTHILFVIINYCYPFILYLSVILFPLFNINIFESIPVVNIYF